MRDFRRAIEILIDIEDLIKNKKVAKQCLLDRANSASFILQVSFDFPNLSIQDVKHELERVILDAKETQQIEFFGKNYLLPMPTLNVLLYTFNCMDRKKLRLKNEDLNSGDGAYLLASCIDIAKQCVQYVNYSNDKIRSLMCELAAI